jgi:hypothetical protein
MSLMGVLGAVFALNQGKELLSSLFPPLGIKYQKMSLDAYPVNIPSISELVEMYYRGGMDKQTYIELCRYNGMDTQYAELYLLNAKTMLPATDYITVWRRGEIDDITLDERLDKLHIDTQTKNLLIKASEYYPNPADLVRFAVREVFTPDIASQYGLYEDMPEQFITEGAKVGLSETSAARYWASHWELPSISAGYEMLHRGVISEDELLQLLRAQDVMPYWRDKLIKISYNPVTRVDVRRMYRTGVYDREQVYQSYLNVGYNPTDAEALTEFTIEDAIKEKTDVTKGQLDKAYLQSLITIEQYKTYLADMGYTGEPISFYVDLIEYDKKMQEVETIIKELKARYTKGLMSIVEVENKLNTYDLPAIYVSQIINDIKVSLAAKMKQPTKEDLLKYFTSSTITEGYFRERMQGIGYSLNDIDMYVAAVQGQTYKK